MVSSLSNTTKPAPRAFTPPPPPGDGLTHNSRHQPDTRTPPQVACASPQPKAQPGLGPASPQFGASSAKPTQSPKPLFRDQLWHAFKEGAWKSYRLLEEAVNSLVAVGCRMALMSTFVFGKMPKAIYDFIERQTFYSPIKSCSLELLDDDELADKIIKCPIPFKTDGGKRIDISAWHIPEEPGSNKPTIVFSHGRHSNISNLKHYLKTFSDQGYGILVYDYPGFGNSEGKVTLENCYKSGVEVCKFLSKHKKIPLEQQILVGYSLGTHITSHMAATIAQNANNEFEGKKPKCVVLLNSFPKLSDGVTYQKKKIADRLFLLPKPVALKIIDKFFDTRKMRVDLNTQAKLEEAARFKKLNTLIISGDADRELDYRDAQRMAADLGLPFKKMDGVAHNLKEKDCQALFKILEGHLAQIA